MENSYQFSINITTNITFLFINNYLSHQMFVKEFVAVDYWLLLYESSYFLKSLLTFS